MAMLELKVLEKESKPPTTITVKGQEGILPLFIQIIKDFNEKYVNGDFYVNENGDIAFKPGGKG